MSSFRLPETRSSAQESSAITSSKEWPGLLDGDLGDKQSGMYPLSLRQRSGEGADAACSPFASPLFFRAFSLLSCAFGRAGLFRLDFCLLLLWAEGSCCESLFLPFPLELGLWPLGLPFANAPFAPG